MSADAIPAPGFTDPTREAQQVFRHVLDAMAHPGTAHPLTGPAAAPEALGPALAGLLLMLLDDQSPVHLAGALADPAALGYLAFHTGAPVVEAGEAAVVVARPDVLPALDQLRLGSDEAPHESATLVVDARQSHATQELRRLVATGPGIRDEARFEARWVPDGFLAARDALVPLFPRGLDIVVVTDDRVLALPRTCRLLESEA